MWKCWSDRLARLSAGLAAGLLASAPAVAAPALPEADAGSRLVWVPAAVAEGGGAQAMRLTLWPLREPSTGDRNLDALQDLPSVPGEAARPLDAHAGRDSSDAQAAPTLPRAWALPSAQGDDADGRLGQPVLEAAAALLPALSQRQLFGGAEVVLAQIRDDLPDEARMRAEWRAIGVAPGPGVSTGGGGGPAAAGDGAPPLSAQHRVSAVWLEWPADSFRFLRQHGLWLVLGVALLLGLGYAAKRYSRRI